MANVNEKDSSIAQLTPLQMITTTLVCGEETNQVGNQKAEDRLKRAVATAVYRYLHLCFTSITIRAPRIIRASLLRFPLTKVTRSLS